MVARTGTWARTVRGAASVVLNAVSTLRAASRLQRARKSRLRKLKDIFQPQSTKKNFQSVSLLLPKSISFASRFYLLSRFMTRARLALSLNWIKETTCFSSASYSVSCSGLHGSLEGCHQGSLVMSLITIMSSQSLYEDSINMPLRFGFEH